MRGYAEANYPKGFNRGVTIRGVPILNTYGKEVLWADSAGSSNGDGTYTRPYSTVDAAINKANANDIILVKPGHAETLAASGAVTQDVAGVAIVGLGQGSKRPTFTFTPEAVGTNPWAISAAGCSVQNIIGKPGLDAITNPFNVSGAAAYLDIEWQDASSAIEAETVVLTTAAADQLEINLTYRGFTAGNACVAPIKLVGCTDGRINVDFHGKASTSVVNFITTLSTDVVVTGYAYNSGTTDGSKLVVDTIGSSTWYADIMDGAAGARFTGGSGAAIASDDISAVYTRLGAPAGANMSADIAAIKAETLTIDGGTLATAPVADSLAAFLASGGTALGTNLADSKSIVDALGFDGSAFVAGGLGMYLPRCVEKSDGAVLTGNDNLFTITGGPVRAKIVGVVATIIGGASNGDLQIVVTTPSGTVDLNAAPVAIDNDAAGTLYYNVGATSVFTPVTAGAKILDPVTVEEAEFILPPGTVHFRSSAAQTGVIKWYMTYWPLTPNAVVTAAA